MCSLDPFLYSCRRRTSCKPFLPFCKILLRVRLLFYIFYKRLCVGFLLYVYFLFVNFSTNHNNQWSFYVYFWSYSMVLRVILPILNFWLSWFTTVLLRHVESIYQPLLRFTMSVWIFLNRQRTFQFVCEWYTGSLRWGFVYGFSLLFATDVFLETCL